MNLPRPIRDHRTIAFATLLVVAIFAVIGYRVGLHAFLAGTMLVLTFLREQAVTILFLFAAGGVVGWMVRLHFSEEDDYKNFKLQKLLVNSLGEPDKKSVSLWLGTVLGAYAFLYLLHHDRVAFVTFAPWFLGILFGYHGANEILGKKKDEATPQ